MRAWLKQNELKKQDIPSREEIKFMAERIADNRTKSLFILLYLTAARISEIVYSLRKKDLVYTFEKGREILLISLINRKNKNRTRKQLPIPLDKEKDLIDLMIPYLDTIPDVNSIIFAFNTRRAYQLLDKEVKMNPHWIRHIRLTHLITIHDFNENLLIKFAGWTDGRPAKHYSELKWRDILQKY